MGEPPDDSLHRLLTLYVTSFIFVVTRSKYFVTRSNFFVTRSNFLVTRSNFLVTPAQAGVQALGVPWIPAFAGMTVPLVGIVTRVAIVVAPCTFPH
jgi:hypothetical protein